MKGRAFSADGERDGSQATTTAEGRAAGLREMVEAADSNHVSVRDLSYAGGLGMAFLGGLFISTAGVVLRHVRDADEWQILFYRSVALTVTMLLVLAVRYNGQIGMAFQRGGHASVLAGVCLIVTFTGFIYGLMHSTVANAVFLNSAGPFFAAVLGWMFLGERVTRTTAVAIALASLGIAIMMGSGIAEGHWVGSAAALTAAAGFGAFAVVLRSARQTDMFPAVCLGGVFTTIVALAAVTIHGKTLAIAWWDLGCALVLGVVQLALGLLCLTTGSRSVPAAELSLVALSEVVLGPIWVWLAVGEVPSYATLIGGTITLCTLAGLSLIHIRSRQRAIPVA